MKKILVVVSLLVILILASCAPAGEEPALTVGDQDYNQSELEALGIISIDYTNKDGDVTAFNGVPIAAILEDAGVANSGANVTFTAADNYEAETSLDEVMGCADCIIAFDDGSLRVVMPNFSSKLQVKDLVSITVQ